MKKLLLFLILLIPCIVFAEECDTSKITIDSISLVEKSDDVVEVKEASVEGKTINLDLSVVELGDSAKYKLVFKNDSDGDYEINEGLLGTSSDYIEYSFESTDDSNVIKAKSTKEVLLNVKYKTAVPRETFVDGKLEDNKSFKMVLSADNEVNPATLSGGTQIVLLIVLLVICLVSYILIRKKKYLTTSMLIMAAVISIPFAVKALCKYEIVINAKVLINKDNTFDGVIYRESNDFWRLGDEIDPDKITCANNKCIYVDEGTYDRNVVGASNKYDIKNNIVINAYACMGDVCILGGPEANFEENKALLDRVCPATLNGDGYECNMASYVIVDGNVSLGTGCGYCFVSPEGVSSCQGLSDPAC